MAANYKIKHAKSYLPPIPILIPFINNNNWRYTRNQKHGQAKVKDLINYYSTIVCI